MTDKILARKHFDKAFDYYFKGSRRAIKEAREAIKHNPKWSRPHWLLGTVFMHVPPPDIESAIKEYREVAAKADEVEQDRNKAETARREAKLFKADAEKARDDRAECSARGWTGPDHQHGEIARLYSGQWSA